MLFLFLGTFHAALAARPISIQDVTAITLRRGEFTLANRGSPVPQLRRVGGNAPRGEEIDTAQCRNTGYDGIDVNWECKSNHDDRFSITRFQVSCEGYSYPEDEYITAGSCALEYVLDKSDKFYENGAYNGGSSNDYVKHEDHSRGNGYYQAHTTTGRDQKKGSGSLAIVAFIVLIAVVGVAFFILKSMGSGARSGSRTHHRPPPTNPEFRGNNNDNDDDDGNNDNRHVDPPPPPRSSRRSSGWTSGWAPSWTPRRGGGGWKRSGRSSGGGWWGGAAAGGALGYAMGRASRPSTSAPFSTSNHRRTSTSYHTTTTSRPAASKAAPFTRGSGGRTTSTGFSNTSR